MSHGFLYSMYSPDGQINDSFENQLLISIDSLKSILPNCSICLHTNIKINKSKFPKINFLIYDEHMPKKHICKAYGLLRSPYQKTIFLDCDILVHRKIIEDIFIVLDEFDFTCCYGNYWERGTIFPDLNTGILGVRNNLFTKREIERWIKDFEGSNLKSDQKHFREIFMRNKKKFHILPWWFQNRAEHFIDYKKNTVVTHSREMNKDSTIQNIKKHL